MKRHDDNVCSHCGLNGHWSRACGTLKHILDLYQASIKVNGERFEIHFAKNAYEKANIEVNNALIEDTLLLLWTQNHLMF